MRKNDASVAKIANTRLTNIFVPIFALAERLPTSATVPQTKANTKTKANSKTKTKWEVIGG